MMNPRSIAICALATLGPACCTLAGALALGVEVRAAVYGSVAGGIIGFATALAQHRLIDAGLAWALGGQLAALLLRLVLATVALALGRAAGIGEAAVLCMALPLAVAVLGDAALLARASARLDVMAEDPARA